MWGEHRAAAIWQTSTLGHAARLEMMALSLGILVRGGFLAPLERPEGGRLLAEQHGTLGHW